MNLTEICEANIAWAEETFPDSTKQSILEHLLEELEEFKDDPCPEELADIFLLGCHYSFKCGFDLTEEVVRKFKTNQKRIWVETSPNGRYRHSKDKL